MNEKAFAELFGGEGRFKVLRHLFEHPGEAFSAREIAADADLDPGNTHRWLQRWAQAGLVQRSPATKSSFQASADPALSPLVALFQQSSDLVGDLKKVLADIPGIKAAIVFGSFARHEEKASSDIDVLVLGDVSELKTNALLRPLAREYGREFNASVFEVARFHELLGQEDEFAVEVMRNKRIPLIGDLDALVG